MQIREIRANRKQYLPLLLLADEQESMIDRYPYEEQWKPKNILVTFRTYQLNLDGNESRVCKKYWDTSAVHFIEPNL